MELNDAINQAVESAPFDWLINAAKQAGDQRGPDDTVHHFSSGVYAKQMHIRAGYMAVSHKHSYDHLSILAAGQVKVRTEHGTTVYTAPAVVTIRASEYHAIYAIKDAVWFCIHATDETDPEMVDQVLIQKEGG